MLTFANCHKKNKRGSTSTSPYIGRGGFSLLELLVVISIISILAFFAYVNYNKYKLKAYFNQAKAVLEQTKITVERYYADHDEYPHVICNNLNNSGVLKCSNGIEAPPFTKIEINELECNHTSSYIIVITMNSLESANGTKGSLWIKGPECENPQKIHCNIKGIPGCIESPPY